MTVRILRTALEDLTAGRKIYDLQTPGFGYNFLTAWLPSSTPSSSTLASPAIRLAAITAPKQKDSADYAKRMVEYLPARLALRYPSAAFLLKNAQTHW